MPLVPPRIGVPGAGNAAPLSASSGIAQRDGHTIASSSEAKDQSSAEVSPTKSETGTELARHSSENTLGVGLAGGKVRAQAGGSKNEQDIDMMMDYLRDHGREGDGELR